jgi:hypothetical protein
MASVGKSTRTRSSGRSGQPARDGANSVHPAHSVPPDPRRVIFHPAHLLQLNRLAGNGAVAQAVLQRWGAKEHEMLGDKGSGHRQVKLAEGYELSFGEVVALAGDHFANIEQMRAFAKNTGGGARSRAEIEYAREWKLDETGRKWDEEAKEAQTARYYTLAGANQSHFLNPSTGDADKDPSKRAGDPKAYVDAKYTTAPAGASQAYRMNHVWAIREAVQAARRRGSMDEPLAVEAFGAHYLTDAFSAGHVRTPRASAKAYWDAKVPMFVHNLTGFIAEAVAAKLGVWQKHVVPTDATLRLDFPFGLGALAKVEALLRTKRFTFGDVVGLALHDWDNAKGVRATIHGTNVELLGDNRLRFEDNDAMPYAIKAVNEGVLDIEQAFAQGHKGHDVNAVLDGLLQAGLFAPEQWLPKAKPDADQKAESKSIKWDYPDVFTLLADPRFGEAVELFLKEKESDLTEVANELEPDQRKAFEIGVLAKLRAAPVPTLMAVVQWVPSLTKNKAWEADTAADYYHSAEKIKGGAASLTLHQRVRLMNKLMFHRYAGKRELLGVLTTAPDADARKLIRVFGWERLHGRIDEKAMPFKDAFPRADYGR